MNVIAQVVMLFLLMLCGLASSKGKLIQGEGLVGLNKLLTYFALPCLTIAKLQQDVESELMHDLGAVFLLGGVTMLIFGVLARFVIFRKEEAKRRAVLTSLCIFSNAGYMGYPVLTAAFGAEKLIYGVMYVAVFNVISWSVGVMIFDPSALDVRKLLKVPSLLASLLGIILFVLRIRLPGVLLDAMNTMADVTTPLAMFIIGARLAQLRRNDLRDIKLLATCALRLLIFPILVYYSLTALGFSGMVRAVVTLCTAMPCAATTVIQAESYGGDAALASRGVAMSTLLSIATIPLMLMLL